MRHIRTAATDLGEQKVKQAFRMMVEASTDLTIWEFEEFIRSNLSDLGGRGFVASIGKAIQDAATLELALNGETGTESETSANTQHAVDRIEGIRNDSNRF